jgi:hypothetical protein
MKLSEIFECLLIDDKLGSPMVNNELLHFLGNDDYKELLHLSILDDLYLVVKSKFLLTILHITANLKFIIFAIIIKTYYLLFL